MTTDAPRVPEDQQDSSSGRRETLPPRPLISLSPSRANDFLTCPLMYRYKAIDKIPERPSSAAVKGTLVHAVLEDLFDRPPAERTIESALEMLLPRWNALLAENPEYVHAFTDDDAWSAERDSGVWSTTDVPREALDPWVAHAQELLRTYFTLEDPRRLSPHKREMLIDVELESGLTLRGYIDRIDRAPNGALRIVDYKTGKAPSPGFEDKAMFQMRFYALAIWRLSGAIPRRLQLMYLGDGEILWLEPDEASLLATERKLISVWEAIERAMSTGEFRPNKNRLCGWCSFKPRCPEWSDSSLQDSQSATKA